MKKVLFASALCFAFMSCVSTSKPVEVVEVNETDSVLVDSVVVTPIDTILITE